MRFNLFRKLFARKTQPILRRPPVRVRPQLEYLEGRMLMSGSPIFVNAADVGAPIQDGTAAHPYATITQGVTAAANGDTVQVAAGTYNELVDVNKSISILGAQSGNNPLTRSGPESIVDGNSGSTAFEIGANDVTINGFTVQGQTSGVDGAGIYIQPGIAAGTHLQDNIIQNNVVGLFLANNSSTDQAVIQNNLFQNNTQAGPSSGSDIYADQYTAGTGGVQDVLIQGNTFTNSSPVADSWGIGMSNTDAANPFNNISVIDNNFSNTGRGLYLYATNNTTVTGNTFTGTSHYAIGAFGAVNGLNIQHNTIENGGTALYVEDDLGTPGTPLPNSNINANYNNIVGNTTNVLISNAGTSPEAYTPGGTLDATNNYWGSPNGPAPGTIIDQEPGTTILTTPYLMAPVGNSFILLLDKSGKDSLSATSNGIVQDNGGSIIVDSNNAEAAVASQNGFVGAANLFVSGGAVAKQNGHLPAQVTEAPTADPLASLPAPTASGPTFRNERISGNTTITLHPGTYLGGITISGNAHVTFAPGVYILKDGGLTVSGNATVVTGGGFDPNTGNGVLIYQASSYTVFGSPVGGISIGGNASVDLIAPNLGTYTGIAVFEDQNSKAPITISGKGYLTLHGTLYAPKAAINLSGGHLTVLTDALSSGQSNLIAADLHAAGSGVVTVETI